MAYVGVSDDLCRAIVSKDLKAVEACITDHDQINRLDCTGRTPLHLACTTSTPEIVSHLIGMGAHLTQETVNGKTAFHLAAIRGDLNILKALRGDHEHNQFQPDAVDKPAPDNFATPLHLAILFGHRDAVRYLVQEFGADINRGLAIPGRRDGEPERVIPTLALSLHLPPEDVLGMWSLMVDLKADLENQLLPHYIALSGNVEILKSYLEAKKPAGAMSTKEALNSLCQIQASSHGPEQTGVGNDLNKVISSPLTGAIAAGDETMALALLNEGASPVIDDPHGAECARQPVAMAIEANLPSLAIELTRLLGHSGTAVHADKLAGMVRQWLNKLTRMHQRQDTLCTPICLPKRGREPAPDLLKGSYQDFLTNLKLEKQRWDVSTEAAGILRSKAFDPGNGDQRLDEDYQKLRTCLQNMVEPSTVAETPLSSHTCQHPQCLLPLRDRVPLNHSIFEAAWNTNLDEVLNGTGGFIDKDPEGFTCLALAALRDHRFAAQIVKCISAKYKEESYKILLDQIQSRYPVNFLVKSKLPTVSFAIWAEGPLSLQEDASQFEINTLSKYAIVNDDCELLRLLMSTIYHHPDRRLDDPGLPMREDVALAVSLDRQECIQTIIEVAGVGCFASSAPVVGSEVHTLEGTGAAEREHPLLIAAQLGNQNLTKRLLNDELKGHYQCYVDKFNGRIQGEPPCWLPDAISR